MLLSTPNVGDPVGLTTNPVIPAERAKSGTRGFLEARSIGPRSRDERLELPSNRVRHPARWICNGLDLRRRTLSKNLDFLHRAPPAPQGFLNAPGNRFPRPRLRSCVIPSCSPHARGVDRSCARSAAANARALAITTWMASLPCPLNEMLRAYGAAPALFLPSRMDEGYGLSREGLERCWQTYQPQLLIAVDCGTSSGAEIAGQRARGADVIVLDHHEPKAELPDCVALVNPKTAANCEFRYLCSVGIVFKLCHALLKTRPLAEFDLRRHLDLVALGTVADIVPRKPKPIWFIMARVQSPGAFVRSR